MRCGHARPNHDGLRRHLMPSAYVHCVIFEAAVHSKIICSNICYSAQKQLKGTQISLASRLQFHAVETWRIFFTTCSKARLQSPEDIIGELLPSYHRQRLVLVKKTVTFRSYRLLFLFRISSHRHIISRLRCSR